MSIVNKNKNQLIANWLFLVISILSPFLALPFLSRVLGQNNFGIYLTVLAMSAFVVILCDYGFNVTSARRIALNKESILKKSEIVSTTSIIKVLLVLVSIIFFSLLINISEKFIEFRNIYIPTIILFFSLSMQPIWYFIGTKKIIINSVLVSLSRLIPLPFLFYFVKDAQDLYLAIHIQSIASFLCLIISYLYILTREKLIFKLPKISIIFNYLRDDIMLLFSNILIGIYASLNSVLLGLNASYIEVATYAGIERIFKTLESLLASSSSIFFPSIARKININKKDATEQIRQISKFYAVIGLVIVLISLFFGSFLLKTLYGDSFNYSSKALFIVMFIPLFGSISTAYGNLGLLNLRKNKTFFKNLLVGSIFNILIVLFLGNLYGAVAAALGIFSATIIICFLMYHSFKQEITKNNRTD